MSATSSVRRRSLLLSASVLGLSLVAAVPAAPSAFAQSLPAGADIIAGTATIGGTDKALTVKQSSDKAIIDWKSFSIAQGNSVRFENGKGATLNRVTGSQASSIDGLLTATGSVYLINKNGIVVGKTGVIDVGGTFVGSTHDMSNDSFLAGGDQTLAGLSEAAIINYGKIGSLGGDVALVAAKVENKGSIDAANGTVGLLAGYQVLLRDYALDDGKFSVVVGGADTSVTNEGALRSAEAELRAQGGNIYALAGNTKGVIDARGVSTKGGRIFLTAGDGEVQVASTLTARKAEGQGGDIEVTGKNILLGNGAKLDASGTTGGTVLVGGDWQGGANADARLRTRDVQHADAVVMAPDATIDVSGSQAAGGKAVLWSDHYTNFEGTIDARGATDGGMVETSSKNTLRALGSVDAAGSAGQAGDWLLDPSDITISTAASSGGSFSGLAPNVFTPSAGSSVANVNTINTSLSNGTSVTITTAGGTGGNGDITLASAISKTGGSDATLTLKADRNIVLNNSISSTVGKLNVLLNSRASDGATGTIAINSNIATGGGDVVAWGGSGAAGTGAARATSGTALSLATNAIIDAGGGNINLRADHAGATGTAMVLDTGSQIKTTGAGRIDITGQSASTYAVVLRGTISAAEGAVTINGTSGGGSGVGVGVANYGSKITTTTGAINVSGTATGVDTAVWLTSQGGAAVNILSDSGNISITGATTDTSAGVEGVTIAGNGAIKVATGGTGSLVIAGQGGVGRFDQYRAKAAVGIGKTHESTPLTLAAGTGGLTISGNANAGAEYSVHGWMTDSSSISSTGAISIGGNMGTKLAGLISAASDISIGAQTGDVAVGGINQTGTTGVINIGADTGNVTIGAINLATNSATALGARGTLTTGAITTSGSGDITLAAGNALTTAAVTKSGINASTLTVSSNNDITVGGAISTSAGALNVKLNSRASGAASGAIAINSAVTTRGGNVFAWGGNAGDNAQAAVSTTSTKSALQISAAVDAGGGNVSLWGENTGATFTSGNGYGAVILSGGSVTTTGTGTVTMTGASGLNHAAYILGSINTADGDVTVQGASGGGKGSGVGIVLTGGAITTGKGAISLTGTSTGLDAAIVFNSYNAATKVTSASGNITLTGTAQTLGSSAEGIGLFGANELAVTTGGAGSVTFNATGGSALYSSNRQKTAIILGFNDTAANLTISAGTGGLTMRGNGLSGAAYSIYGNLAAGSMISSTGAIDLGNNNMGVTLLGGTLSKLAGAGDLTVNAATGNVQLATVNAAAGQVSINAAAGNVAISGPLTQNGTNDTVAIGASGSVTTGALNLATNNTTTVTAGTTLNAGAITTTGNGNITLAGDIQSLGAITKRAAAKGDSTLLLKATGNLTLANAILAETGAGKLNVDLNTRSADAATGGVRFNADVTTAGGNLTVWGGSAADRSGAAMADGSGFQGVLVSSGKTIDAGGGNIVMRAGAASSATTNPVLLTGSIRTSGAGKVDITGDALNANAGIYINAAEISSGTGGLSLTGTGASASGVRIGASNPQIKTTGDLTINGTSQTFAGFLSDTTVAGTLLQGKNVTITGRSVGSSAGGADSTSGILFKTSAGTTIKADNKVTLVGTGGATNTAGGSKAAIGIGSGNIASDIAALTITAGSGGVLVDGTGAHSTADFSFDSWALAAESVAANLSITSAGAVEFKGNKNIFYRGSITQTGGGASSVSTTGGHVLFSSYAGSNADSFTINADSGFIRTFSTISATKDLTIKAGGGTGDVRAAVSAGGALSITARDALTTMAVTQTGTTGTVTITSAGSSVSTGAISLATKDATLIKSASSVTTGAITTTGSGDITLDAVSALTTPLITKKSAATGASTLTLKSAGNVVVANAITAETGAGALNVNINSRAAGGATGTIAINAGITTRGGNVIGGGGASGTDAAIGSDANGVTIGAVTLDARGNSGGNIAFKGQTSTASTSTFVHGIELLNGSSLITAETGSIALDGQGNNQARGVTLNTTTLDAGSGGILLTGRSENRAAIAMIGATQSMTTMGDLSITGTSSANNGIWRSATGTGTISGRNVNLTGHSTGGASSLEGILFNDAGATNITGSNSVSITGSGGALVTNGASSKSAIAIGSASHATPFTVNAGAGGLTITANADSAASWGFDNFASSTITPATSFTSAGAITVRSNKGVVFGGSITQTGAGASSIISTAGAVALNAKGGATTNPFATTTNDALTISGTSVSANTVNTGGALSITATGSTVTTGALSSGAGLAIAAATAISTGTVTQTGSSGNLALTAGSTLSTGEIITSSNDDMMLTAGSGYTPAAITKKAAATGESTLTIKSDGGITISNPILAEAGAGKLNVVLNSRAKDAATGAITVNNAITTRGGNILLRGGSAALDTVWNPALSSLNHNLFVSEMKKTGAQINLGTSGVLTAGGGNIEIRGIAGASNGLTISSGTLETTGTGSLRLYGLSGTSVGDGINISGINTRVRTADGSLTIYGASQQNANSTGVFVTNGANVTSSGGGIWVGGAANSAATGAATVGVAVTANGNIGVTGGSGPLVLTGAAGSGTSGSYGIYLGGGSISSASSGVVNITGKGGTGTGSDNYGIYLDQMSGTNALINTTGSGVVTLNGTNAGGTSFGIYQGPNGSARIGTASATGNLTLVANRMMLNGSNAPALLNTSGVLTLRPQTGGAFTVDNDILPALIAANTYRGNYSSVVFGSTDASSLTFNTTSAANSYSKPLTLASGGALTITGTNALTASQGLTFAGTGAVTQTVDVIADEISGTAASLTLDRGTNAIAGLGNLAVSDRLSAATSGALTVKGAVTTTTGLIRAAGDLTVNAGGSVKATGSGTALNLTTGTKFVNNAGASALSATTGRWLLWAQDPTADTLGTLNYGFRQYGAVYGATAPALATGNGVLYTITPSLTVTLTGDYKRVYDGTANAALAQSNFHVAGLVPGDTAIVYSSASFDDKNVGTGKTILADDLAVVARNGSVRVFGYALNNYSATGVIGTITPKALTASLTGTVSKTYDGTITAAMQDSNYILSGVIGSEAVELVKPTVGRYFDKNAGTNKVVAVSGLTLTGADAANYVVASDISGTVGTILAKALSATLTGSVSKTYDGTTVAAVNADNVALSGLVGGDAVIIGTGLSGTYADRNVGADKTITVSGLILTGADAANYTLANTAAGDIGTITAKSLTLNAVSDTKTYDGSAASNRAVQVIGLVGGDTVAATQAFDSRHAGARTLQVNDGWVINDGNGGSNYVVAKGAAASGMIDKRLVTTGLIADSKVYDGTTSATGRFTGLTNTIASDEVSLDTSDVIIAFLDRHAGNGKAVAAAGYALVGADAANYILAPVGNSSANISKAVLTLTAAGDSKVYDGTTASAGTVGIAGLVVGDTASATQAFDSRNAGSRALVVDGWTVNDGNDGGNYTIVKVDAAGTIARKMLTGNLTGTVSKVYDGTTTATLAGTDLDGVLAGDRVIVSASSANYADRNAGTGKLVTVSGLTLSGMDAGNYILDRNHASANIGTITARQVGITVTGRGGKVYDGTALLASDQLGTIGFVLADGDAVTQSLLGTDNVTIDASGVTGHFEDRNAGTGKGVALTGYTLANNALGNYVLANGTVQGLANVARRTLTLTAASDTKVYDGTTASSGQVRIDGAVGDDIIAATQRFDSRNAGTRSLLVDSYTIDDGNNGGNYAVVLTSADGLIGKRVVSTTVSANDKIYDGTTLATGTFGALQDKVAGDDLSVTATLTFADKHAGANKAVTVSDARLTGADAANYLLDPVAITNSIASISKANLVLTASADRKVYDGTTASSGTVGASGLVGGDSVTATQRFDSRNAGTRSLLVDDWAVSDGNGGNNYAVILTSAAGVIDQKALTASFSINDKVYDGSTAATGTFTGFTGLVNGDAVTLDGSRAALAFADRNVGNGKAVSVTGATLSGADAANYTLAGLAGGTGTITPKALTLTAVADSKAYDGTTRSTGAVLASGLVSGDLVIATQSFADKNAGTRLLQVDSGYRVSDGNGGANYVVTIGEAVDGTIDKRVINASVNVQDKVYDGTTAATGSFTGLTGVVAGETVTLDSGSSVIAFLDRNAGNGKAVTVTGATLSGADAHNYTLGSVANGTANITRATLTLTAAGDTKVYDGTTASAGTVGIAGLVAGDTASATQAFDSRNAGSRALVVDGWTVSDGNGGGNYTIVKVDAAGTIARKVLTGNLTGTVSKVYDGTMAAILLPTNLDGIVAGDAVAVSASSAEYADRNVGTGKLVTVSGLTLNGADAGNYILDRNHASANIGTITARQVAVTVSGRGAKTYDGTTLLRSDQLGTIGFVLADGDAVTQNLLAADGVMLDGSTVTGTLADRNAGTGKGVALTGYTLANNALGNYVLATNTVQGLANISKAVLTLTAASDSKVYDGTATSGGVVSVSGLFGSDTATASQVFDSRNAGSRTLVVDGWTVSDGNDGGNYTIVKVDAAGTIARKVLTGNLTGTVSKVYDGTTTATLAGTALDGVLAGDRVIVSASSANYADRNAGTGKLVTVSGLTLSGMDAGNYILDRNHASANIGTITARQVGITVTGRGGKVYDGTALLASDQLGTIGFVLADGDAVTQSLLGTDNVTIDASGVTGHFEDRNAGTGKRVTLTGYTLANNALGNYVLANGTTLGVANVARRTLTLTAAGDTKVYDGTTASAGTVGIIGLVAGDTASATQRFDSRNAGSRTLVVDGWTVNDGNDGGNYAVITQAAAGAINKRVVSSTVSANDKVYDGTTLATGTFGALQDKVAGDDLSVTATLAFADKHAGANKAVTVSDARLTGADAGNYRLDAVAITNSIASISKANLVLTASADRKVYDGTTASSGTVRVTGLAAGDSVTATQAFDSRNAGNRTLAVDGWSIDDGNGGNNYVVTKASASGIIDQKALIASFSVNDKVYDGTTAATGHFTGFTGLIGGDAVTVDGTQAVLAFLDRNVGNGKAVSVTGATLSGADAANYTLAGLAGGTGTITPKALTLTAVADSKAYDGTTRSTGAVLASGLVSGDLVIATQSFADKNAGTRLLQVDSGYRVSDGNGGANYVVTIGEAVDGTIDKRVINASVNVQDKVYDGTTAATGSFTGLTGVVAGETVTLDSGSSVIAFLDRNAGNGKAVTVTGATLSGADAHNYTLGSVANGTANITRATLTLTAAGDTKVYDGTTASAGTVGIAGLVAGDTASATQAFDSRNAGSRALVVDGWTVSDGNGGGNYTIVKVDAAGTIARKVLTGNLTGTVSKVYDGTMAAILLPTNLDGIVAGDAVAVSASSAEYADRNVGTGKLVTVSGLTLNGADAGNYILDRNHASANIGTITARQVAVTVSGRGAKTYDGTALLGSDQLGTLILTAADGDAATQALLAADGVALEGAAVTGTLADRNAGTGKLVTLAGYALANNALGNYVLTNGTTLGVADVARRTLTLTAAGDTKVYDGTTASAGTVGIIGLVAGDTASATQRFDNRNAGSRTLVVDGWTVSDGNDGGNYTIVKVDAAGTIARKVLTGNLTGTVSKVYDGTTTATGAGTALDGVLAGDRVIVSASSANYADRNAGTGKRVTVSGMTLSGVDAANYTLASTEASANIGTITARQVGITVTGRGGKTYDGTALLRSDQLGTLILTATDGDPATLALLGADNVTIDASGVTGHFEDRNAGIGKGVALTGYTLANNALGNYVLATNTVQGLANISKAVLTLTAASDSKVYDGTATSGGVVSVSGLFGSDTATASQVFDSRNAGSRTLVVDGWTVSDGNDGGNYTIVKVDAAGTIARKVLTGNLTGTVSKVYDGTTTATLAGTALDGVLAGDRVIVSASSANYADRNAGTGKLVTVSGLTLSGMDAGNYILDRNHASANIGTITARQVGITVTGRGGKVYDGTALLASDQLGTIGFVLADGDAVTQSLLGTDNVTIDASGVTGHFEDRNAGTGKRVTLTGYTLANNALGNYVLANGTTLGVANVARRTLTLTAAGDTKVYDGTTASAGTVGIIGLVAGDTASATQRFDSRNAGSRTLVVDGWTVNDGNDGGNYAVITQAAAGAINKRVVSSTVSANDKVYDGTTTATGSFGAIQNMVAGDSLDVTGTLAFADKHAGANKTVTVSDARLTGADAGNYLLDPAAITNSIASISKAKLVLTAGADRKVYDGTTASSGMVRASGLVGGDTATATQAFDSRNAGNRTLAVDGWTVNDGNGGGNYTVVTVDAAGAIAQKVLTGNLTGTVSKVYDGTTTAMLTGTALEGVVAGDQVIVLTDRADYADQNVGTGKRVTASGMTLSGVDAANYVLASTAASADIGTITPRAVTVTVSGRGAKTYDGTALLGSDQLGTLILTAADGDAATQALLGADNVTIDASGVTGHFEDRNAGTGKRVTLAGYALANNALGNYVLTNGTTLGVADVDRAKLTLNAVSDSKVYDGTIASAGTVQVLGLMAGDNVIASQAFNLKDAGERTLTVQHGYIIEDGNQGSNYDVTLGSAAGRITQRELAVIIANASKTQGQADPALTYQLAGSGLVDGDTIHGSLSRDGGEDVGTYIINGGTLSAGNNYKLSIKSGTLQILASNTNGNTGGDQPTDVVTEPKLKIPPTSHGSVVAIEAPGTSTGFNSSAGFGWAGASRLPGGNPISVQVNFGVAENLASSNTGGMEGRYDEDVQNGPEWQQCRGSGAAQDESCSAANGAGLPYPANHVITPNFRFVAR